jgi:UDP-N-acetylglucosamine 2-epimerase
MKVLTVVGARPQFIKSAPVSRALRGAGHQEFLVHTGQHYDRNMSEVFFRELQIPEPDANLGIGSGSHGRQTGRMLMAIEDLLLAETPDWVLVYGDTNSTLAGALAAAKLHVPVAHVEAGLRSFNRRMPEEHNRVLSDHMSDILFCPTAVAAENLRKEGIVRGVHQVGDVMYDSVLHNAELARRRSDVLRRLGLTPGAYGLATVHRAENTDDPARLRAIFGALETVARDGLRLVAPLHPRTRKKLAAAGLVPEGLDLCVPAPYLDMLMLEMNAKVIATDSGGVQKEAYWFGVPCVTLRDETEWVELVEAGVNVLAGADPGAILDGFARCGGRFALDGEIYGDGNGAAQILERLVRG